jgi:hypothetical protein
MYLLMQMQMPAHPNSSVNIRPVKKFYIGRLEYKSGTAIRTSSVRGVCAVIDFTPASGRHAAIVKHKQNGEFDVTYPPSRAAFARSVSGLKSKVSRFAQTQHKVLATICSTSLSPKLWSLIMIRESVKAPPVDGIDDNTASNSYKCTLAWTGNPTPKQKQSVLHELMNRMTTSDKAYEFQHSSIGGSMIVIEFSHQLPSTLRQNAIADWKECCSSLPQELKVFTTDPWVVPAPGSGRNESGASRSHNRSSGEHSQKIGNEGSDGGHYESLQALKERARRLLEQEGLHDITLEELIRDNVDHNGIN